MTNPTSNFGWQMPTNTDLVTDLPADFAVFGQAVDTSMADLLGGTTGQILAKATGTNMDFTWINNDQGDITGVTAGTGITVTSPTGPVPTVSIDTATTVDKTTAQTLTNKTLTAPIISTISNTGTVTLPTATDTLVGRATTDTLTNKTLTSPVLTTPSISNINAKGDILVGTADNTLGIITAGSNGETLLADSSTSTGLRYNSNFAAGKNVIINGNCQIAQRGSSVTSASTLWFYGAVDRFLGYSSSASTATVSQQSFTPGTAPASPYEAQFFVRSASTNTATYLATRLEDVRIFAGQTVTLSFYAKTDVAQTLSAVSIDQNFGSGGSATVTTTMSLTPALTTGWQRFSGSVAIPSISGKTVGTSSYLQIQLQGAINKNIDVWGWQLEAGSVATAFQTATGTIQGELAACQRYYYRTNVSGAGGAAYQAVAFSSTTTNAFILLNNPVAMRVVPTSIDFSALCFTDPGVADYAITGTTLQTARSTGLVTSISATVASGLTATRVYYCATTSSSGYIGVSSEL